MKLEDGSVVREEDYVDKNRPDRNPSSSRLLMDYIGSEYTDEEREFIVAMDRYIHDKKRPFPAFTEVLLVLKSLGYRRTAKPEGSVTAGYQTRACTCGNDSEDDDGRA